jgi:DNA repair ATPase RecN
MSEKKETTSLIEENIKKLSLGIDGLLIEDEKKRISKEVMDKIQSLEAKIDVHGLAVQHLMELADGIKKDIAALSSWREDLKGLEEEKKETEAFIDSLARKYGADALPRAEYENVLKDANRRLSKINIRLEELRKIESHGESIKKLEDRTAKIEAMLLVLIEKIDKFERRMGEIPEVLREFREGIKKEEIEKLREYVDKAVSR